MLQRLPPELVLEILQYLPLPSLYAVVLSSKHLHSLITSHEQIVYHNASLVHSFPSKGIADWKVHCQNEVYLTRSWLGKEKARIIRHPLNETTVHRIKVDDEKGLVMTTSMFGGLIVCKGESVWREENVRAYAHLEYSNGYIVFDRFGSAKEVWKHIGEANFELDKILQIPEPTRAFRFVYPTLLVCAPRTLFLLDIRSGEIIQSIPHSLEIICYVELNEKYAFVCGESLQVYERQNGRRVLDLTPFIGDTPLKVLDGREEGLVSAVDYTDRERADEDDEFFTAAHVCGNDLAALLSWSRLLILRNWIQREETIDIQLGDGQAIYLAFEHNRIGVVTTSGIYVVHFPLAVTKISFDGQLARVTCLQMTRKSLFVNEWRERKSQVCQICFERREEGDEE